MNDRSTEHPSDETLEHLAAGRKAEDSAPAKAHLDAGCVHCATKLRPRLGEEMRRLNALIRKVFLSDPEATAEERRELVRRTLAWRALGETERETAPELLDSLLALSTAERREAIRLEPRYASHGLALHLVDAARAAGFRDPAQALELAKLATEVAERLEPVGFPRRIAADAQALAWASVSNAYRISAELIEAERAMKSAKRLLAQGTGHPDTRAEVLSLEGSLRTDEARFDEAVAALEEAARIYQAFGNRELEGKILVQLGNAAGEGGDVERAVALLEQARQKLGRDFPGELLLIAAQALVDWLVGTGKTAAARRVLDEIREESRGRELSFFLRQRVEWVAARLVWSEGDLERAERELRAVRERYRESEQAYRYCLVSLDLAGLLLEQSGRTAEVRGLAHEMLPVFQTRRIHNHALAALVLFQRAAEAETVTVALIRDLGRYLRHAQNNPYLAFQSAS
jgi:tetratricopeptide (TPR) repeat protein